MSALRISPPSDDSPVIDTSVEVEYVYDQPIAIPSYLIAIAGGEVVFAVSWVWGREQDELMGCAAAWGEDGSVGRAGKVGRSRLGIQGGYGEVRLLFGGG